MLNLAAHRRDWTVAICAAIILLLQATLSSFASAAGATGPALDAFGNPLCITSSDASAQHSDGDTHHDRSDCCTAACGMFAPAVTGTESATALLNPLQISASRMGSPPVLWIDPADRTHGPGSPRSPPHSM